MRVELSATDTFNQSAQLDFQLQRPGLKLNSIVFEYSFKQFHIDSPIYLSLLMYFPTPAMQSKHIVLSKTVRKNTLIPVLRTSQC